MCGQALNVGIGQAKGHCLTLTIRINNISTLPFDSLKVISCRKIEIPFNENFYLTVILLLPCTLNTNFFSSQLKTKKNLFWPH